jgi:uncharacterized protein (DUF433 family)
MLEATDIKYIVRDEKVYGGKPTIEGHRIAVHDVAASLWQGLTPEQIATEFDLQPAHVYAALAYYYDHKAQIDREIKDEDAEIRRLAAADEDPLAQRMRAAIADRKRTERAGA